MGLMDDADLFVGMSGSRDPSVAPPGETFIRAVAVSAKRVKAVDSVIYEVRADSQT
jgi:hypothetical protein